METVLEFLIGVAVTVIAEAVVVVVGVAYLLPGVPEDEG